MTVLRCRRFFSEFVDVTDVFLIVVRELLLAEIDVYAFVEIDGPNIDLWYLSPLSYLAIFQNQQVQPMEPSF